MSFSKFSLVPSLRIAAACALAVVGLNAQAAKCTALKSGNYWAISPMSDAGERINKMAIDATTLSYTTESGGSGVLNKTNETCAFIDSAFGDRIFVSKSGVAASTNTNGFWGLSLPVQSIALRLLAGNWNFLSYSLDADGAFIANNGVGTVTTKGRVSIADCGDGVTDSCGPLQPLGSLTVNDVGGFNFKYSGIPLVERWFAVKAKDGKFMMVGVGLQNKSIIFGTPVQQLAPLAVGDAWSIWDIGLNSAGASAAATRSAFTVTASDAVAGSFTRQRTEDCRVDTLFVNNGRTGMVSRPAGSYTRCDGSTGNYGKFLMLGGLNASFGFSPYGWTSSLPGDPRYFGFSVVRP